MKTAIFAILGIIGVSLIIITLSQNAPQSTQFVAPEAKGHVNDYANVINLEKETQLEADLESFKPEIAVLTIKNMNGLSVEDYSMKVAEAWKVGDKNKDDGVILVVSTEDRKVRIEVGYGSEEKINDAKAGRILDENVLPHFKNGDWESGILEGVLAIKSALK